MLRLNKDHATTVAVVSSCQMVHAALRALVCNHRPVTLIWHSDNYQQPTLRQLFDSPVDLLILSLHVYHAEFSHALRLIQALRMTHPRQRLLVAVDTDIPFLISHLQDYGVGDLINLKLPLREWEKHLHFAHAGALADCRGGNESSIKKERLSATEYQILNYLTQGISIAEIAYMMQRCVKTVAGQKNRALHKMGISHYAQLVAVRSILAYNPEGTPFTPSHICLPGMVKVKPYDDRRALIT